MKRAMMRRNNAMAGVGDGNRLAITNDDTSANIVHETPSPADAEIGADTDKVISKGDTEILDFGEKQREDVDNQGTSKEEDQAGPDPRQSHVALVGPNPEPMHDDFVTTIYPQVHEILKHTTEEHVQMDNPLSLTGTLSSMKNLDNFNFDDQFIAEKSQKMNQVMVMWISKLSPWFFTLELRDLPHKINQTVNEVVKEAVHVAFQAPLRDRFRELPEADMKENYSPTGSLEVSIERANRDEFLAENDKSCKRYRDD
ncbi:hypothetical protein Tco_0973933 [Tanacetum coccineum]|uniref:Uncharacterized protein n=1 Tax=Tanacetum coccineum TaxID=301880 RepID=A0ABQ5EA67_9ASTR